MITKKDGKIKEYIVKFEEMFAQYNEIINGIRNGESI